MGRHSVEAGGASDQPGQAVGAGTLDPEPDRPPRSVARIIAAVVVATLGLVLLVFGIFSLTNTDRDTNVEDNAQTVAPTESTAESSGEGSEPTETSAAPPPTTEPETTVGPVRLPVTVANNSPVVGLASELAAVLTEGGWQIAELANYRDSQLPQTTIFFTAGSTQEQAAAESLRAQFPQITGIAERTEGLPGSGLLLVGTGDWVP